MSLNHATIEPNTPAPATQPAHPKSERQIMIDQLRASPDDILNLGELMKLVGFSRSAFYRWEGGTAPIPNDAKLPRNYGTTTRRFLASECLAFYFGLLGKSVPPQRVS